MKKEEFKNLSLSLTQASAASDIFRKYKQTHDSEGKRTSGKNAGKVEPCILETFKTEDEVKKYLDAVINYYDNYEEAELSEEEQDSIIESASEFLAEHAQLGVTGDDVVLRIGRALLEYGNELKEESDDRYLQEFENIKNQMSK